MTASAVFSTCGQYRYLLTRGLGDLGSGASAQRGQEKMATFIMLNPSTADARCDDATIRKCIGFARRWQCDTLQVLNLFAVRATLPREMKRAADPVGPENFYWFARTLTAGAAANHLVICAWGVHGSFRGQERMMLEWLHARGITLFALGYTRGGHPRHPLYAPYAAGLVEYAVD